MIDWNAIERAAEEGGLDEGHVDANMADAALVMWMVNEVRDTGRTLEWYEVPQSCIYPLGGPRWPWENIQALDILADEPGFDLQLLLVHLPADLALP